MFKLSLISLFFLSADNTLGTSPTLLISSSTAVSHTKMSLNSRTTLNSKATPDLQMTLNSTMSPNSKINPNSKTILNPKTTLKTAVISKTATTTNTMTMKSGGTTLNQMGNIYFLFYVIVLLFCVQSGWSGLELSIFLSQFFIICWMTTRTLGKSNFFQLTS